MPTDFAASGGDIVVMTHERANGDHLVVALRSFRGRRFADVRVHYRDRDGALKPGAKGISLGLDEVFVATDALVKVCRVVDGSTK